MRKTKRKGRSGCLVVFLLLIAAVAAGFLTGRVSDSVERGLYPVRYRDTVDRCAAAYGVPDEVIYAVILTESSFDPAAESSAGARGLMQLTEPTFDWLSSRMEEEDSFSDLWDPAANIRYGTCFLSVLYEAFGQWETVYAAYNAGMNRVAGWLCDPALSSDGETLDAIPLEETAHYVEKVTAAVEKYEKLYRDEFDPT